MATDSDVRVAEFSEACAHYRYLEQERTKYLISFFGLLVGIGGFFVWLMSEEAKQGPQLFGALLLIWVLNILVVLCYLSVRRLGHAREAFSETIEYLRNQAGSDVHLLPIWRTFWDRPFSIQRTVEWTFFVTGLLIALTLIAYTGLPKSQQALQSWQIALLYSLAGVLLACQFIAMFSSRYATFRAQHSKYRRAANSGLPNVRAIDHVVLRVSDIERMRSFYCDVLGARHVAYRPEFGMSHLRVGTAMIDLVKGAGPTGCNMDHLCLRVDPFDQQAITSHLKKHGVEVGDIKNRFGAEGNGVSIYLNDPEGNVVELKGPSDGSLLPLVT